MCAYETDKDVPHEELYYNHQAVSVASYVKDIVLVTHVVRSGKVCPDIRQTPPVRSFSDIVPALQRGTCIRMSFLLIEFLQPAM